MKGFLLALDSWHWFTQLISSGSFTRAADVLQMSQQTISSRLATLERELGCRLVIRSTPLALTRAGEVFLSFAQKQDEERLDMLRALGDVAGEGAGLLKIGISNMRGQVLMPTAMERFHQSLPGVSVKLMEGTNEDIVRMVERDEVDFSVGLFEDAHPGIRVERLFREEVVGAIHPDLACEVLQCEPHQAFERLQSEGLDILNECPFLVEPLDDICGRVASMELRRHHIKPQRLVESTNMMTLLSLCERGIGAIFCPVNLLDAMLPMTADLLRIPLSESARYDISIGTPIDREAWMPAQVFEDVLGELYGD